MIFLLEKCEILFAFSHFFNKITCNFNIKVSNFNKTFTSIVINFEKLAPECKNIINRVFDCKLSIIFDLLSSSLVSYMHCRFGCVWAFTNFTALHIFIVYTCNKIDMLFL